MRQSRRVTVSDVAREAGVSLTTVSHALNGKGRVDERTRELVIAVAKRLDYVPNRAAQELAAGRGSQIGLLLPDVIASLFGDATLDTDWYGKVLMEASRTAFAAGKSLTLLPNHGESAIIRSGVSCLLLVDPVAGDSRVTFAERQGLPHVLVGSSLSGATFSSVQPDIRTGFDSLMDHLQARGARSVAILTTDIAWQNGLRDVNRSLTELGRGRLQISEHVIPMRSFVTRLDVHDVARTATHRLLEHNAPDAIVAQFEGFAHGAVAAAAERGMRVGSDILIAQDTDSAWAAVGDPPITSLDMRLDLQLREAVALCAELSDGKPGRNVRTSIDLHERASTRGADGGGSPLVS